MQPISRKSFFILVVLAIAGVLIIGAFVWSGIYNVGADDAHTRPVYALLVAIRKQSIASRAQSIDVPNLSDPELIREGAGNYDSMCTGCHLAPGMQETELSKGLNPAPPAFAKTTAGDPAHHFWVIKHGIKATGMAAWGKSMGDRYIWGMVAFLQKLPDMSPDQYRELVETSGGHSHGTAEEESHSHDATEMPSTSKPETDVHDDDSAHEHNDPKGSSK